MSRLRSRSQHGEVSISISNLQLGSIVVVALEVGLLELRLGVGELVVELLVVDRVDVKVLSLAFVDLDDRKRRR